MKSLLALLFLSTAAQAAVIGYAANSEGRIELHDEAGVCLGEARRAEYIANNGDRTPGCWRAGGTAVHVVFLDGDVATVPLHLFRKPDPA